MKKYILVAALILCSHRACALQTGRFHITIDNNGVSSEIYFYVPEDYDSSKAWPLLWAWHGAGMPASEMLDFMMQMEDDLQCIIACPDANSAKSREQLNYLTDCSYTYPLRNYHIDSTKIVITGYSWGGMTAYLVGLQKPALVRGIIGLAPVIGISQVTGEMWDNMPKVRMATILGNNDNSFLYIRFLMDSIKKRGGSLLYLEKDGLDHGGSNGYYESEEFFDDYLQCYNYVIGNTDAVEEYPNERENESLSVITGPAAEFIAFNTGNDDETSARISIYNSLGNCILTTNEVAQRIDISVLDSGAYFLVMMKGSRILVRRFMVMR